MHVDSCMSTCTGAHVGSHLALHTDASMHKHTHGSLQENAC